MTTVGIVSDTDELLIKYRAFGYRETIIPVDDFDQLEELDILAVCFDNDNWLLDTMEWLISVRQHPAIYTWVLTPRKATLQEKEIFLGLGAISVLSLEDSSNSIIYSIRNTYYKLSDKDYQNREIEFLQDNTILLSDQRIQMTSLEYKVLRYLFEHINKTVVYEEIYQEVWSNDFIPDNSRTKIANIISRLRKLIEDNHNIKIITIRDTGYICVEKNNPTLNF